MSRRITIATQMDQAEHAEEALTDLEAVFTKKDATTFQISGVKDVKFMYTGANLDTASGKVGYDEDDSRAKLFATNQLPQAYVKSLTLANMAMEGTQIDSQFYADESTHVEGCEHILEAGDYVIYAEAPMT